MTAIALTIAGSDSGGGAGIQADLKTFSVLGVYGASAVTAVTAQNTRGVFKVEDISPDMVAAQVRAVLSDLDVDAIKIGMVSRVETIEEIAKGLRSFDRPIVLDPVMVATSGDQLLQKDAVAALKRDLVPLARIITPNLPEAAALTDRPFAENEADMARQAEMILDLGAGAVLMKGGHGKQDYSTDLLFTSGGMVRLAAPRLSTTNDHGTGCTLAAAITSHLALGRPLEEAVRAAKNYLHGALEAADRISVGQGRGPVHHFHAWWPPSR